MNRIMIVDEEEIFRVLYDDELTEEGYKVFTVDDGTKLFELIEEKSPDLIVLGLELGECDGLDILQDIRNTYYDMPVILCSICAHLKHDPRSIAANYYVVKDQDLTELKLRIKMAIESAHDFHSRMKSYPIQQMNSA